MTGMPGYPRNLKGMGMDALRIFRRTRRVWPILWLTPVTLGCEHLPTNTSLYPPQSIFEGRDQKWVEEERARREPVVRSQAPDDLKMPESLPPIKVPENLPPPAAVPAIQPTAFTTAPGAGLAITEALREQQIQIAAYIGTDAVITEDEIWQMVRQRGREYVTLTGSERSAKERELYAEELRKIVERELVIIELTTRLKKNKKEEMIQELQDHAQRTAVRRLKDYQRMNSFATEEEFHKVLQAQGLSYKGLRRQLERDSLSGMFLEQTLREKVKFITLNDLWDYYQANAKDFQIDDEVKWLDLFIAFNRFSSPEEARKYADGVWHEAKQGGDFVQLVKKYGQGDSNLRDGEGIGQKRGEIQPQEMEDVIFTMDAGQVSPLLQTATGYHIVKVVERQKAGVKPFDRDLQTEIRERLARQVQKQEYERLLDELWRKYRPKVVENR